MPDVTADTGQPCVYDSRYRTIPLASFPEFGPSCLYDDEDDPTEVTVFPGDELSATEWLTADVDSAVPVEDVR